MPTMEITMKKIKSAAPAMAGKRPLVSAVLEQKLEKFVTSASYTKRWWPEILVENTYQLKVMKKLLVSKKNEAIASRQKPLKFIKVGLAPEKRERRRARRQNQLEKQAFDQAYGRLVAPFDFESFLSACTIRPYTLPWEGYKSIYAQELVLPGNQYFQFFRTVPYLIDGHMVAVPIGWVYDHPHITPSYRLAIAMIWDDLRHLPIAKYSETEPEKYLETEPEVVLEAINHLVKAGFVVKQSPSYDPFSDKDVYEPLDSRPSSTFREKGIVVNLVY